MHIWERRSGVRENTGLSGLERQFQGTYFDVNTRHTNMMEYEKLDGQMEGIGHMKDGDGQWYMRWTMCT